MWPLLIFYLFFHPANAQFAEIASLATSLLGSGLGPALGGAAAAGSAAAPGLGALSQIGQLYQLAQGALQLTGTGVGVLNQASEGNWFPAVLEQASKNTKAIFVYYAGLKPQKSLWPCAKTSTTLKCTRLLGLISCGADLKCRGTFTTRQDELKPANFLFLRDPRHSYLNESKWLKTFIENLMGGHGFGGPPNLGSLGPAPAGGSSGSQIGPEFGTGFPAPNVEDYTDNTEKTEAKTTTKAPETLVNIDDNDFDELTSSSAPTAAPTPTVPVTLFPEEVTTDGDSRVQVTNKAKSDGDENLLVPERASAAKTLNAKIRSGVPDLTKLIDVLRKSNLKESEIMEIVSQVEGNDNVAPPPKIDFTSAVQNIPLKKHLNRERIAKASRELHKSIEPQEKAIEAHINQLRQLPDLAASATPVPSSIVPTTAAPPPTLIPQVPPNPKPDFTSTNRLQREISSVPAGKAPFPQPTPTPTPNLLLPQPQFTTPPNYFLQHQWQHPQFPQPQLPVQPHPTLYQPQPVVQQPVHPLFQPNPYQQFPYQQYQPQQPYGQVQVQQPLHPAQQQQQPGQTSVDPITERESGSPPQYNKSAYLALSAPTRQSSVAAQQAAGPHVAPRSVHPGAVLSSQAKMRGVGYTNRSNQVQKPPAVAHGLRVAPVSNSPQVAASPARETRNVVTSPPHRRYPVRTARTQRITTPAPQVKLPDGIFAHGGLIVNADPERRPVFWKRYMHHSHQRALARSGSAHPPTSFFFVPYPRRQYLGSRRSTHI
ncbi:hypothetical protein ANCCEY_00912 [Ancylostoma ceylanicum]|uniref:Uncharacterized protein n=1 Tax=Ancylostoma ceylanicum TaxID=53326 RepID=A0A0D6M905_9BILA|nr:hypothetical protein ANCCEY_00912 [Ancylostoma ceylanicum]